jgi:Flp pilus assembly protein TadD
MSLAPGATLARYEIISLLGAGGMGEVYLARDPQLDRRVAIKVLPAVYTSDPDRVGRFEREARAASALNHPGIITIHEVGAADGLHFIAAEFIDGDTLRGRMARGRLTPVEALDVAIQIASALAAAHAAGVVHRDIKPENVMIRRDGFVKVVDFGLAKLTEPSSEADPDARTLAALRTQVGAVVGTAKYMAPEQASGLPIDARADIFSLGVMLQEMLAGSAVSGELERILTKTLRPRPEERYQGIQDLLLDLKTVRARLDTADGGQPARRLWPSLVAAAGIAVAALAWFSYAGRRPALTAMDTILLADFVNTTGEPVFDGTLKQALAVQLRQTPFLNLFPEEAVRETLRLMERSPDEPVTRAVAREICQRERLKALLAGTIAPLGRLYVITIEVVNAQTGEVIASQQIEAESKERVLRALGEAATELRRKLGESLATLQKYDAPIERVTTASLDALKAFSAGHEQFMRGNIREALPLLNRAVELDSGFVEAYDDLAWASANIGDYRRSAEFASKGYALRDRVSELEKFTISTTYEHWVTGDWDAERDVTVLAKRLYTSDWNWPHSLALSYYYAGQDEKVVLEEREAIRLNPNIVHTYRFLAFSLVRLNRFDEAKEVVGQSQARKLDGFFFRATLFLIASARGDAQAMRAQLELIADNDGPRTSHQWEGRAEAFAGRWRSAQALYRVETGPANELVTQGALFGQCRPDSEDTARLLALSRISSPSIVIDVPVEIDGSLCGSVDAAQRLADELAIRYPNATAVKGFSLPVIHAAIALRRDRPDQALEALRAAHPYEAASSFRPNYLRGQAYLRLGKGADAASEFRTILEHRGWQALSVFYPLAHLGLARASVLSGDAAAARRSYENFFTAWKDADADVPALVAARKEYGALK